MYTHILLKHYKVRHAGSHKSQTSQLWMLAANSGDFGVHSNQVPAFVLPLSLLHDEGVSRWRGLVAAVGGIQQKQNKSTMTLMEMTLQNQEANICMIRTAEVMRQIMTMHLERPAIMTTQCRTEELDAHNKGTKH